MKKIRYIILMLIVVCSAIVPINAQEVRNDNNFFLDSNIAVLDEIAKTYQKKYNFNVVIVSTDTLDLATYANQYYQDKYGNSSGIIFVFNQVGQGYVNAFGSVSQYLDLSVDLNNLSQEEIVYKVQLVLYQITSLMQTSYQSRNIIDMANLLTDGQEKSLTENINKINDKYGLDVALLTTYSLDNKDIVAFADDYYDYNSYGNDGMILVLYINKTGSGSNGWYISTAGEAINAFSDWGINYLGEAMLPSLKDANYYEGFNQFVDLVPKFMDKYETGSSYDVNNYQGLPELSDFDKEPAFTFKKVIISVVAGLVISLLISWIRLSKLKSKKAVNNANEYVKKDSLKLTNSKDLYLYQTITKTRKPDERSRGSSGGGSSTHSGSSGKSHGGGGGSF